MDLQSAIRALLQNQDLNDSDMTSVMQTIMTGEATPAQIGGFLIGLQMKGETATEITAAAKVMRSLATPVNITGDHIVDTCGTGGDGASTFNVSTASAFVVAAAGAKVAKHGNRSISSSSGSADVLEAAGVNLELTPDQVKRCIDEIGIGFLFAQKHHSAMKHAIGPRREMGVRTIFNLLGPLTNPAQAKRQVLGVFDAEWVRPMAEVLQALGSEHVLVVHAEDGLDEISIGAPTHIAELHDDTIKTYTISPEEFGFTRTTATQLSVNSAVESLAVINDVFADQAGPARDIVVLNAGAAIYAADLVTSLQDGIQQAHALIANGAAKQKMNELVRLSQQLS
jgi:anthranilate phosphoribosyltransferase